MLSVLCALVGGVLAGCEDGTDPVDGGADAGPAPVAAARFDLGGSWDTSGTFYDFPYPSDLRLRADGTPNLDGFPGTRVPVVGDIATVAQQRRGWSPITVAHFRFDAEVAPRDPDNPVDASADAPFLLVDVDPDSPERGRLFPTVAFTVPEDRYAPDYLLSVASHPGIVLHHDRTYAFVVMRSAGAADGTDLEVSAAFAELAAGQTPSGARGADAAALYAPLFETLDTLGVPAADVATATVFTTGDEVAALRELTDRLVDTLDVEVTGLTLDGDGNHEGYCELVGSVGQPQFQVGTPPFNSEGLFEFGDDGLPIVQRMEETRVVVTVPKGEMPAEGFPLMVYFHGSGGIAAQVVDRGPAPPGGFNEIGAGPAAMIAEQGFGAVGAALPLSPDRLPGAGAIEYLNFNNLAAFRDTFRQGVIEQRLLIEALTDLTLDPAVLGACGDDVTLPAGATEVRFDPEHFVGMGQSMGGMYTNLIGAVEPRLSALVPTGAGGFWSFFVVTTSLIENLGTLLGDVALQTEGELLRHLHPALALLELGWEAAEPMVFMPRLSIRPLEGIPPRPIYQPIGQGDSFFPTVLYDAVTLAYGHPQAGPTVWPTLQDSLALAELDGPIDFPVSNNLMSESGVPYTGAVVQSAGDGFSDPHSIYVQVPGIRHQWTCFLGTQVRTGTAVIPPLDAPGTECPTAE